MSVSSRNAKRLDISIKGKYLNGSLLFYIWFLRRRWQNESSKDSQPQ